jgi:hypothetical protein
MKYQDCTPDTNASNLEAQHDTIVYAETDWIMACVVISITICLWSATLIRAVWKADLFFMNFIAGTMLLSQIFYLTAEYYRVQVYLYNIVCL